MNHVIRLKDRCTDCLTRNQGESVRSCLVKAHEGIGPDDFLVIDFAGINAMTPSFADECFGKLAERIGSGRFILSVKLTGAVEPVKTLINSILTQRLDGNRTNGGG